MRIKRALTAASLRRAGVDVVTFTGELLSIRNGGPHCLVMPPLRGSPSRSSM